MKYLELISANIKNLRLENNLTQEEFAEKIEISIQGLSNIERGRYQPNAQTIDKICSKFKITPADLLCSASSGDKETLDSIMVLLLQCPKSKLKKIYEIIKLVVKL